MTGVLKQRDLFSNIILEPTVTLRYSFSMISDPTSILPCTVMNRVTNPMQKDSDEIMQHNTACASVILNLSHTGNWNIMLISLKEKTQSCFFFSPEHTFIFYKLAINRRLQYGPGGFLITAEHALNTGSSPLQMFICAELLNIQAAYYR